MMMNIKRAIEYNEEVNKGVEANNLLTQNRLIMINDKRYVITDDKDSFGLFELISYDEFALRKSNLQSIYLFSEDLQEDSVSRDTRDYGGDYHCKYVGQYMPNELTPNYKEGDKVQIVDSCGNEDIWPLGLVCTVKDKFKDYGLIVTPDTKHNYNKLYIGLDQVKFMRTHYVKRN